MFELGYTNNPSAVEPLLRLTNHELPMARAAAIASLGLLRASDQLDLLVGFYKDRGKLEKVMALKAIGDLDTPESRAFFDQVAQSRDTGNVMIRDVVDLYR